MFMITVGFAVFLFIATLNTTNAQHAALTTPAALVSPDPAALPPTTEASLPGVSADPAPPHPLKPRALPESPYAGIARGVLEAAKGLLRNHGR